MTGRVTGLILDESKWLAAAMLVALAALAALIARRGPGRSRRIENQRAMNLFYGCTIGCMSFGHLLAVTVKVLQGTLLGSPWLLYPLGLALAVPAWWLASRAARWAGEEERRWRTTTAALNAWLGVCLLAFGLHNAPLAAPAALNVVYLFHSGRAVGWAVLAVTVAANLALFVGALVFLASGKSFEEFGSQY